ncbi:hypothetical protein HYPSUDRAFT_1041957 [Hypholoma sublateritium FD-334 SS-4]|uniref:Uncharacterized protein n=1 Tax=Hypholoma sublateritium (strain FD-334 SS-4) TaxID=945553 RepID=A0A0D2KRI8_HYPSF|nr:hypothetical protein HYPSUDRAFT_1041957 [Hypholoma sublateritium FD-334 SS-4]
MNIFNPPPQMPPLFPIHIGKTVVSYIVHGARYYGVITNQFESSDAGRLSRGQRCAKEVHSSNCTRHIPISYCYRRSFNRSFQVICCIRASKGG